MSQPKINPATGYVHDDSQLEGDPRLEGAPSVDDAVEVEGELASLSDVQFVQDDKAPE